MIYNQERPNTFNGMVGQRDIVTNIRNQSMKDVFFQVYILGGQFGSGKTTMARIIALAANCKHKDKDGNPCLECESCKAILNNQTTDIIEMDAASNTGIDTIRDLKDTVAYVPSELKRKVYIIDEVHMLSKGAFNSLLKTLEEPPEYCIFILCTTDVKAIPATVRSRAANYNFGQIGHEDMVRHLKVVAEKHGIKAEESAYNLIAKNSQGALRNALSLLEQVSKMGTNVTGLDVERMLGISDPKHVFELLSYLLQNDTAKCICKVEELEGMGKDLFLLISDMLDICADAIVAGCAGMGNVIDTEQYKEHLAEILSISNTNQVCLLANELIIIRDELRKMPSKTTVVVGLIRITSKVQYISDSITKRIESIEKKLASGFVGNEGAHVAECKDLGFERVQETWQEVEAIGATEVLYPVSDSKHQTELKPEEVNEASATEMSESNEQEEVVNLESSGPKDIVPQEEKKEEAPEELEEPEVPEEQPEIDIFDCLNIFGKIQSIVSDKESKEKRKDCPSITEQVSDATRIDDAKVDGTIREHERTTEENRTALDSNKEKVIKGIAEDRVISEKDPVFQEANAFMQTFYYDNPHLRSAIELGCIKHVVNGKLVLKTDLAPIYTLVKAYVDAYDFPCDIEMM